VLAEHRASEFPYFLDAHAVRGPPFALNKRSVAILVQFQVDVPIRTVGLADLVDVVALSATNSADVVRTLLAVRSTTEPYQPLIVSGISELAVPRWFDLLAGPTLNF
jgi:hypothetical protein